jgi:type I restriction enzyme S subunit
MTTWRRLPLKHVAGVRFSNVDKKTLHGQIPVRLCNYTDVYYNQRIVDEMPFMDASATAEQVAAFTLRADDVLLTKDSETADDIGVSSLVTADLPGVLCGYHLAIVRPRPAAILGRYLRWALVSTPSRQQFEVAATGVTRFGLRQDSVAGLLVPVPTLDEQRAIADYLDAETARIDRLVDGYRAVTTALLDERAAITVAGVTGALRPGPKKRSSLPWLSAVPANWDEVKLTLLARLGSGHTPSREHPEWWTDCTIPWITTGEVWQMRDDRSEYLNETREMISELGLANSSAELRPAGTVVLSRTASAGFSAIMGRDMATSQDYMTWTCGPRLRPRYLLLCLRAMRPDLLGRLAMGSTHQTIYVPDIQSIRIPLPPIVDQDEIVDWVWARLLRIDSATAAIGRQIDLLLERRQALITAAVTGQIEIPGVAA